MSEIKMLPEYEVGFQAQTIKKININLSLLDIPTQWRITKGQGIKIGVLDTGLPNHQDVIANVRNAKNFTNSSTMEDKDGHSTFVCGLLAANSKDKENGLIGICPESDIYIAKVLNDKGIGNDLWLANGIYWCIKQGCHILNMSLGAPSKLEEKFLKSKEAVKYAYSKNVYMFAASGNEGVGSVNVPAKWNEVFCISAIDEKNNRASFSNYGQEMDFANIGVNILSSYINNGYASISGTSAAVPGVVGLSSLILSEHFYSQLAKQTPLTNFWQMRSHLIKLCTDLGAKGYDPYFGWGIPTFLPPSQNIVENDTDGIIIDKKENWLSRLLKYLHLK